MRYCPLDPSVAVLLHIMTNSHFRRRHDIVPLLAIFVVEFYVSKTRFIFEELMYWFVKT
uniref:Uncharacterized protein n=1 Tax=Arundo donax TaxID=35708 RepID=A0A0A9GN45_ARUDO